MGAFITLLGLSIVVFIHECGHLFFAKFGGIGVLEFSVGMGPKIASRQYKDTLYSLRLLPIGGYVRLAGLDASNNEFPEDTYFHNRPLKYRFLTILAGSAMNLIFAFLLFFLLFYFTGIAKVNTTIEAVVDASPAFEANLQVGDEIKRFNGVDINDIEKDFLMPVRNSDEEISLTILRGGSELDVQVTPFYDDQYQRYRLGIQMGSDREAFAFFLSLKQSVVAFHQSVSFFIMGIKQLLTGQGALDSLSGPIGIIQVASSQLSSGFSNFVYIIALISITLGIVNLLPIPVLDGGHLVFLAYEAVTAKPFPKKAQMLLQNIFTLLLLALMFFVIFNDIQQWSERDQLLNEMAK